MAISQISTENGTLYVELNTSEVPPSASGQRSGAQQISVQKDTYAALQSLLNGLGGLVRQQMAELTPDEVELEAHIGFAGEFNPIPFLASAKSDATLSLKLVWKNAAPRAEAKSQ